MDLIAIGLIAAAFAILLSLPRLDRRDRREDMGLPPYKETWTWPERKREEPDT